MMPDMKKHAKRIIPTVFLLLGIAFSLTSFLHSNQKRIARQNEEYIGELTIQRAISIDNVISENLTFIHSTAYLYGLSLTSPWADVAVIRDYEENTIFDYLRFVDESGDDYTSRGVMANLKGRAYIQAALSGETGVVSVPESEVTGERLVGFYSPVYFQERIIGVMVGFYQEEYIRSLLEYELYGYEGEGWLIDREGTVIGHTSEEGVEDFYSFLQEKPVQLSEMRARFQSGEAFSFTYPEEGGEAIAYAEPLNGQTWYLVRTFPAMATKDILRKANKDGRTLIASLVLCFLLYGAVMALEVIVDSKRLREENQNANDISTAVQGLFSNFISVDLRTKQYSYLIRDPALEKLPPKGDYSVLQDALSRAVPEDGMRKMVEEQFSVSALRASFAKQNRFSLRLHAPAGEGEWYTFNFVVLDREENLPARLMIISQDVTALHRKEEEEQRRLERALNAAEKASRAKTDFLFNMSHDLRTPMNAIMGYTHLSEREDITLEEMKDYVRKIDTSGRQLLALINDILEMSRIESGKMVLSPKLMDLVQAVEEMGEMFASQMEEKKITFSVDAIKVRHRFVSCDKHRLDRVLLNLLSNACKFTPQGGRVCLLVREIETQGDMGSYQLEVADSGIGMSEEFASRLFVAFERERTSTVSGISGTGLGLSITKSIVELMGGSISVKTKVGEGSRFVVSLCLPLLPEEEEKPSVSEKEEEEQKEEATQSAHLLLVEDNAINMEIAKMILEQLSFTLDTAVNGQEALEKVKEAGPGVYDAILMDIQMPVMDGYEATRQIRALSEARLAKIPIIAMTAKAFQEAKEAAKEAGMDGHIAKPLQVDTMLATIQEVLKRARGGV